MLANQDTIRIPVYRIIPIYRKNTGIHIDTYTPSHLYFYIVLIQDIVRVKLPSVFYLYLILGTALYTCHLREIIAMLNWMYESVYSNTICTVMLYKIPYCLQNLCTVQL